MARGCQGLGKYMCRCWRGGPHRHAAQGLCLIRFHPTCMIINHP